MVIGALLRYGYRADAARIAKKYIVLVETVAEKTGQLWEKYNAETGDTGVSAEYQTPPMMGWTAGIYLNCKTILNRGCD